jgi:opacity protein-like surface antigen
VSRSGGRNRDDRIGIGGKTLLTEKVGLTAEISEGGEGIGGRAQIDYNPTADDHYYLGYTLDPFRSSEPNRPFKLSGNDWGAFVMGVKHNFSEELSVFSEDSYDVYGRHRTLAQTYGVAYTPNARWTVGGAVELGEIEDDTIDAATGVKNSDFDRTAISASLGYRDEDRVTARLKGELRVEDSGDGKRDRTSYLLATGIIFKLKPDWRLLLNGDLVISDASDTLLDGEYAETSLGFAYRPVDNDRFNALFKYTFLYDLPGPDQVTVNGTTEGPAQRSHIVSADVSYDVSKKLTIGAKYGARFGEIKDRVGGSEWEFASAHLAILRADLHIVHEWDLLIEGRALWTPETDSTDWGLLAGVYRHLGDNVKIGVGYNFGRFSDDLRDLTYDDQGVFINVIGKL